MNPEHRAEIRRVYDALGSRDLKELRSLTLMHPEFVWQAAPDEPETAARVGPDAALSFSGEVLETFDRIDIEVVEEIDLAPDAAIFVLDMRVRGAASGADTRRRESHLWTIRDGLIGGLREFRSVEDARAAAQ
jgi:ketosteroid isomerase-like protein